MTDKEALELLRLLHKYVTEYDPQVMDLGSLAADLAMSMDETTDEADQLRRDIEALVA